VITVGDHATHFDLLSLKRLIQAAGFDVLWAAEDVIAGELTLLARKSLASGLEDPSRVLGSQVETDFSVRHFFLVESLEHVAGWLTLQRESHQILGIFGSSIAGTWAGSCLNFTHDFWVDEDLSRDGRYWMNRKIVNPSQARSEDRIVLPMAPMKADGILQRFKTGDEALNIACPPLPMVFEEELDSFHEL
jgi:hypothetical protein